MTGSHPDIGPELRQLAQTILDRLDRQQVWCPVCALAALAAGEQHPLLTVIAEHSVALLAVIRSMVENIETPPEPPEAPPPPSGPPDGDEPSPAGPGRYQHIPVTVEE